MSPYDLIRRPVVSEKNTLLMEDGQYIFEVAPSATKHQVKDAIQKIFKVTVLTVNTMNVRSEEKSKRVRVRGGGGVIRLPGRTAGWKKAIVKLAPGERIDIFEGQ